MPPPASASASASASPAQGRTRPPLPDEPPAIPIEADVAASRTVFVNDNIRVVRRLKLAGKSADEIEKEVSVFARDYPALYKMLFKINLESETESAPIRTMLAMLDRMGKNQITQDQASGVVGQRLYDTYIKPNINDAPPQ
jgi:hypothetical protein